MSEWIGVTDKMPEPFTKVLATYVNEYGHKRIICAKHVPRFTVISNNDCYNDEYNEELDEYFLCEGWYEITENSDEYWGIFVVSGTVTHWMPIPTLP